MKKAKSTKHGLRVLSDRVLIKPDPPDKYEGMLEIPDAYKAFYENLPHKGVVISTGPDCKEKWDGQRVMFAKLAGARIKHGNEDYLLVREYDLDAKILD